MFEENNIEKIRKKEERKRHTHALQCITHIRNHIINFKREFNVTHNISSGKTVRKKKNYKKWYRRIEGKIHVVCNTTTFFYKYMRKLIDDNKLFLALPPLFKLYDKNKTLYAFDEKEKNDIIKKEFKFNNYNITRFKGLGEMPAQQLKETTMDQNKRKLISITLDKAKKDLKNTEKLFETLMGKQAELRFQFIQKNANFIKNLDI